MSNKNSCMDIYKLILKFKKNLNEYFKKSLDYNIIFEKDTFEKGYVNSVYNNKPKKITCLPIGTYHNNVFKWYDEVNSGLTKIIKDDIIINNKVIMRLFKNKTNTFETKYKDIIPIILFLIFSKINIVKFTNRKTKTDYFFQVKLNMKYTEDHKKQFINGLQKINKMILIETDKLSKIFVINNIKKETNNSKKTESKPKKTESKSKKTESKPKKTIVKNKSTIPRKLVEIKNKLVHKSKDTNPILLKNIPLKNISLNTSDFKYIPKYNLSKKNSKKN